MAEDTIRKAFVEVGREKYRVSGRVERGHEVVCDEPESLGGADLGPTPVELFLISIGACKAMTAKMYADRKGWALERASCSIEQTVRGEGAGRTPHIEIRMRFEGDLDVEQRARLLEIAEKCPVQKMITGPCEISALPAEG
jgi:putative redox protein